jgi:hypothetical protein
VRSAVARSVIWLAPVAVLVAAFGASAAPIVIDFDSDTTPCGFPNPCNVLNDFESVDSSLVHFSDTIAENLIVFDYFGSNALGIFLFDDSALEMEFDFVASALSLDFGNTLGALPGDAVLTLYMGGSAVDSVSVPLDTTIDGISGTITYQGAFLFDSAIFRYDGDLAEVVDNIQITQAIPEPAAGLVFGMGALLVGAVCGRRSAAEVELRSVHD